jgi:hypothetical protein
MNNKSIIICLFILVCLTGCDNKEKKANRTVEDVSEKNIRLQSSDITEKEIGDILALDSYIILSNDAIFGETDRIIIDREQIFILDKTPQIVCFDMQGEVIFTINSRGPGPREYATISDFGIDRSSGKLYLFDGSKRRVMLYDLKTGVYLSEIKTGYMAASGMGVVDNSFFFFNPDHSRFPEQTKYYLLYSRDGKRIDDSFLPHDAVADFGWTGKCFYYNENDVLYNGLFDSKVYQLKRGELIPKYNITLPNQLPMKQIEEKISVRSLLESGYAYGLEDIYHTDSILYFVFTKDRFIIFCFWDMEQEKLLYCGKRVLGEAKKHLPFFYPIKGVYKGKFFSVTSMSTITEKYKEHPEYFSEEFRQRTEEDNPVITFYRFTVLTNFHDGQYLPVCQDVSGIDVWIRSACFPSLELTASYANSVLPVFAIAEFEKPLENDGIKTEKYLLQNNNQQKHPKSTNVPNSDSDVSMGFCTLGGNSENICHISNEGKAIHKKQLFQFEKNGKLIKDEDIKKQSCTLIRKEFRRSCPVQYRQGRKKDEHKT